MKAIFALLALVVVASAMTDRESWSYFKNKHSKNYRIGAEKTRFSVFQQNLRNAEKLQAENPSAMYGITKFMDLTPAEFNAQYTNLNVTEYAAWVNTLPKAKSPIRANPIDWRGKAVASVKDQGQCGSCWAFSAAAAMESCMMLKNGGTEVDVSAQQIVDCCTAGGSDGCNGGFPNLAVQWACGLDMATWDSYPYNAEQGTCAKKIKEVAVPKGTCTYTKVGTTDAAQASALQNAPISIALAADVLQYYTGGIISGSDCKDTEVDHAVFLVAYTGSTYVVKNSWAEDWGEQGYFRVTAGKCCLSMCGTSSQAIPK